EDAMAVLNQANTTNPQVQNQKIETYLAAKRFDDAEKLATDVYGAKPVTPAGLFYRGLIRLSRDQFQPAIEDLSAAREKDSKNTVVQLWLARALIQASRADEASSQLEDLLRRDPAQNDARSLLLEVYGQNIPP